MFTLCLLVLAALPQGSATLSISKVRPTLVDLGPTRNDTNYMQGDVMHVTFDVAGMALDEEGRYRYAAKLTLEDSAGKAIANEDYGTSPARLGVLAGGKSRFAFRVPILIDQPPGTYKAKLVFEDVVGKKTVNLEQAYRVLPAGFGLIRLYTGRGPLGQTETPASGVVGEVLFLGMQAVGLSKGKDNLGTLEVTVEMRDATGKVLGKPQTSTFPDIIVNEPLQLRFELPLDQAGKYQMVIKAVDKNSTSRNTTLTVPVTVSE